MGELIGPKLQPRALAHLAYDAGWHDVNNLTTAVAVCLAESQGYQNAFNDNYDSSGAVVSRDVGLWEINIPASQIGTEVESNLYVAVNNAQAAYALWQKRGFEPWVAFQTGVYLHDTYIIRAMMGVVNMQSERLVNLAKAAGQTPLCNVPFINVKEIRAIYPSVPLG
jgi:Lysozyme like domain